MYEFAHNLMNDQETFIGTLFMSIVLAIPLITIIVLWWVDE